MYWKYISLLAFILIIPLLIVWFADSRSYGETLIFSRNKKPVVTKEADPIFNTEVTKTNWKEGFWLGLLPDSDVISPRIMLGVAPLGGLLIVLGIIFWILYIRRKRINEALRS